jgi:hypothetical protein
LQNIFAERVVEMVANLSEQLLPNIKSFVAFSTAVDESTDVSGLAVSSVHPCL